jgi:hypothetical protein
LRTTENSALQVFLGDERVDHPVAFEIERPAQVVVGCGEGLVVIGAVVPGRAVRARAARGQLLRDVREARRALEHQVFEQVRHAALAIALVARPDQVGDVDRDRRLGLIREQQHAQAVGELVLGDAFGRSDLARRRRRGCGGQCDSGCGRRQSQQQGEGESRVGSHVRSIHPVDFTAAWT